MKTYLFIFLVGVLVGVIAFGPAWLVLAIVLFVGFLGFKKLGFLMLTLSIGGLAIADPKIPDITPEGRTKWLVSTEVVAAVLVCEAGGEGDLGLRAVSEVIRNRAQKGHTSPLKVVTKKFQFSCLNGQDLNRVVAKAKTHPKYLFCLLLAKALEAGTLRSQVVAGSTHYHTVAVCPRWASASKRTTQIKNHIFYLL